MKNILFLDYETRSFAPLKDVGAWKYAEHETTDIICLSYKTPRMKKAKTWLPGQKIPDAIAKHSGYFVAHNTLFEYAISSRVFVLKYNAPESLLDPARWLCTSSIARSLNLPGRLAELSGVMQLEEKKLETGAYLIQKYSMPQKERKTNKLYFNECKGEDLQAMIMYCERDVEVMEKIYNKLSVHSNIELEREVWLLDFRQNINGIPVDYNTLKKTIEVLNRRVEKAEKMCEKFGVNVRSPKQLKDWLLSRSIFLENTQEQTIKNYLKNCDDKEVEKLLNLRLFLSRSSIKKFDTLYNRLSGDDRLRYFLRYYGAFTGRWAGEGFQPHNLPKSFLTPKELEKNVLDFTTGKTKFWDTMSVAKSLIPGMIKAEKGKQFIVGDFAAIETRVLAFISGEEKLINMYKKDKDVYKAMAAVIFIKKIDEIDDKERKLGKQTILGCGYGMGVNKFLATCESYGMSIPRKLGERSVSAYRDTFTNITSLWYGLERAFTNAYGTKKIIKYKGLVIEGGNSFVSIQLPSGRKLYYHNVEQSSEGLSYLNFQKKFRVHLYGGILVENVVQAIARDLLVYCMLEMKRQGLNPILHVHDEIICHEKKVGIKKKEKLFSAIMNTPPAWFKDFPLKTETEILERYVK